MTHVIGKDLWYRNRYMELKRTHGIHMDSWYRHGLMVYIATHGFLHGVMVYIWTHGTDNTHGTDSDSCYSIETPTSQTYERAECCPYTGFL